MYNIYTDPCLGPRVIIHANFNTDSSSESIEAASDSINTRNKTSASCGLRLLVRKREPGLQMIYQWLETPLLAHLSKSITPHPETTIHSLEI